MKDYKKILEGVVNIINTAEKSDIGFANICAYIGENCPELKESKGERIREEIISYIKSSGAVTNQEWIAWLEKQGDKPKFKVGDWVTVNNSEIGLSSPLHIVDSDETQYRVEDVDGNSGCPKIEYLENHYHLWTIKDARDGDVLSDGTTIFIFKDLLSGGSVMSYCDYDTDSGENDAFCPLSVNLMCSKITPATKEQRDTLERAMTNAGYEWDAEKKELKKIEQKPAETVENTTWNEEDERLRRKLIDLVFCVPYCDERKNLSDWLKTIKDRVQPKQEWSEEDEINRDLIYNALNHVYDIEHNRNLCIWLNTRCGRPIYRDLKKE